MKKLHVICATAAIVCAASAETVAWYTFDDDPSGVTDASGNFNTLTNADVTIVDGAASFDGTAKTFSTIRPLPMDSASAYTVECFVKADASQTGTAMIMEMSLANGAGGQTDGGFYLDIPDGVAAHRAAGDSWTLKPYDNAAGVRDGQWHHLAAVFTPGGTDNVESQLLLYVDGTLQTATSSNLKGNVCLNSYTLYIGSRGNTKFPFKGLIDDVKITKGALTPGDFMSARTVGKPVMAYWPFDSSETALADASGYGNALALSGNGVVFRDGYASFDGTGADLRTASALDLSQFKDVTVEFFVRRHVNSTSLSMVLEQSSNAGNNGGCFYVCLNDTGLLSSYRNFLESCVNCNGSHIDYSKTHVADAGWHHVALVVDSSLTGANRCRLYVDGVPQSQHANYLAAGDVFLGNQILHIGSRAGSKFFLDSDLDDVRITARALEPGSFMRTRSQVAANDVVAYWPFRRGNPLHDESENGNELQNDGVTFTDEDAAAFSGAQTMFSTIGTLPLYGYDALTIEFFMRTAATGATAVALELGENANQAAGRFCVTLNEEAAGRMASYGRLAVLPNPKGYNNDIADGAADGQWHHYALVYDPSKTDTDIVRLYKDGTQQPNDASHISFWRPAIRSDRLFIGSRNDANYKFTGELDDIRITGRALAPGEFLQSRSGPSAMVIVVR